MVIFNSYVKLPEDIYIYVYIYGKFSDSQFDGIDQWELSGLNKELGDYGL